LERWIALSVFVISCAYLLLFRRYSTMDPDEGIVLQGAERILQGEVVYRDFFSFITPGSYYFLAFLFKIFGSSIVVGRTALAFLGGGYSGVSYLLARRVCSRGSALFVAGLVTASCLPFRFLVLHNWDGTLWACLAVYCAVRWLESPKWIWPFAAASFVSLTFLFEQSKGAGLALGVGGGLLAIMIMGRVAPGFSPARADLKVGATVAVGLAWPFMVTLAYFGARHGLSPMLADWFWPLQHYTVANRVPYGYQNWSDSARQMLFGTGSWAVRAVTVMTISPCFLLPVLPLVALGLLVYWIVRMRDKRTPQSKCAYYVLINAAIAGLWLSVVIVRADIIHFVYLGPLFYLVLAWIVDGRDIPGAVFKAVRPLVNGYVALAFGVLSMALLLRAVNAPYIQETRRGGVTTPGQDTVIEYVQAHVAPGEKILVYPYLPLYYYLTGTFSATRYDYFQPGMHTVQQSQDIVSGISSQRVRVVLFESSFADKIPSSWPATPTKAIASDPVADYLLANYRACAVLRSTTGWRFLFMLRKDLACP
jgi:hypothetical protein